MNLTGNETLDAVVSAASDTLNRLERVLSLTGGQDALRLTETAEPEVVLVEMIFDVYFLAGTVASAEVELLLTAVSAALTKEEPEKEVRQVLGSFFAGLKALLNVSIHLPHACAAIKSSGDSCGAELRGTFATAHPTCLRHWRAHLGATGFADLAPPPSSAECVLCGKTASRTESLRDAFGGGLIHRGCLDNFCGRHAMSCPPPLEAQPLTVTDKGLVEHLALRLVTDSALRSSLSAGQAAIIVLPHRKLTIAQRTGSLLPAAVSFLRACGALVYTEVTIDEAPPRTSSAAEQQLRALALVPNNCTSTELDLLGDRLEGLHARAARAAGPRPVCAPLSPPAPPRKPPAAARDGTSSSSDEGDDDGEQRVPLSDDEDTSDSEDDAPVPLRAAPPRQLDPLEVRFAKLEAEMAKGDADRRRAQGMLPMRTTLSSVNVTDVWTHHSIKRKSPYHWSHSCFLTRFNYFGVGTSKLDHAFVDACFGGGRKQLNLPRSTGLPGVTMTGISVGGVPGVIPVTSEKTVIPPIADVLVYLAYLKRMINDLLKAAPGELEAAHPDNGYHRGILRLVVARLSFLQASIHAHQQSVGDTWLIHYWFLCTVVAQVFSIYGVTDSRMGQLDELIFDALDEPGESHQNAQTLMRGAVTFSHTFLAPLLTQARTEARAYEATLVKAPSLPRVDGPASAPRTADSRPNKFTSMAKELGVPVTPPAGETWTAWKESLTAKYAAKFGKPWAPAAR